MLELKDPFTWFTLKRDGSFICLTLELNDSFTCSTLELIGNIGSMLTFTACLLVVGVEDYGENDNRTILRDLQVVI